MRVAFHKGGNLVGDKIIKWWDDGLYSHAEIVFSDGLWASASFMDGQKVRGKYINPSADGWDYITLPSSYEKPAREFFAKTDGVKYDLFGQVRFIVAPYRGRGDKYWCSEWVAEALGLREPWRYGPNGLYNVLCTIKEESA
jgi:hypothetical protein